MRFIAVVLILNCLASEYDPLGEGTIDWGRGVAFTMVMLRKPQHVVGVEVSRNLRAANANPSRQG